MEDLTPEVELETGGSASHAHEAGERLVGHGCLLQVLGGLGSLLAAVHEDEHLLLARVPEYLQHGCI